MSMQPDPDSVGSMWAEFTGTGNADAELVDAFAFGDSPAMADELDAHRTFFRRECEQRGVELTDDVLVVLERFEKVWPVDPPG